MKNKGPWRITFDTNPDDCNLHCIMCEEFSEFSSIKELRVLPNGVKRRRMSVDLIEKTLEEVKAYGSVKEIIPSTMGEPLMYKEFEKIISLCESYQVMLNLTTNGTFPRNGAKKWAEMIVPIGSDVKISWNGVTKETSEQVMKGIDFDQNIKNLKEFLNIRDQIYREGGNYCSVTLQYTFMEINSQELPELVKFAAKLGIDRIKGHHLWAHFDEIKDQSMRRSSESIDKWNKIVKEIQKNVEKYRRPDGSRVKLDNIYLLNPATSSVELMKDSVCPFLGREAWVAWDGRFNPCCAPDEQRKELGFFGNLNEASFSEIWEGDNYKDLVENYLDHPLCKGCNMRRPEGDIHA